MLGVATLGVADRRWSTDQHGGDQFVVWQQIVADAFVPVDLVRRPRDRGDGFASACSQRRIADLSLSWLSSVAQSVRRTPAHLAGWQSDVYFLNLTLSGGGTAHQDGRTAHTGPGDLVLIDADRPFSLEFDRPFDQLCLTIPKPTLDPLLVTPDAVSAVTVPGCGGLGAAVGGALVGVARDAVTVGPRDAHHLSTLLVPMIAHALTDPAMATMRRRTALLQQAHAEVDLCLADPELTIVTVASRLNISASYLSKLFADHGTSFGRWLLARRLDRAWAALDPATSAQTTVTAIALACGFRDSGHFARTFRARFGITPSDRRRTPAPADCLSRAGSPARALPAASR